jgi:drug/metabolite transporter (DMT)-like permease
MGPEQTARWVALPVAILAVSTSGILIRFTTAPPLQTASYRMAIAGSLLLTIALVTQRRQLTLLGRREWGLLAASGVLLGLHFALWTSALFSTSVASAVLLVDTNPVMVALGGRLFLGESPSAATWTAIGLALLGSIAIAAGDVDVGADALAGDAMALGAAFAFAGYLLIGRHIRQGLSLTGYAGIVYSLAALTLIGMALLYQVPLLHVQPRDAAIWLLLVLIPTLCGHTVINWTLRYLPVSIVSVSILGEPVVTTLLAWLILQEAPGPGAIVGGGLILVGVYVALRSPTGLTTHAIAPADEAR